MGMNSQGHSLAFCRSNTLSYHDLQHDWSIIFVSVANCIFYKKKRLFSVLSTLRNFEVWGNFRKNNIFSNLRYGGHLSYDSRKAADGRTFVARFIGRAVAISTSIHPPKTTKQIVGQGKVKLVP